MKTPFLLINLILALFLLASPTAAGIEPLVAEVPPPAVIVPKPAILPTSPFYFTKRLWENLQLFLAPDPTAKLKTQAAITHERLAEVNALVQAGESGRSRPILEEYLREEKALGETIRKDKDKIDPAVLEETVAEVVTEGSQLEAIEEASPNQTDLAPLNQAEDTTEEIAQEGIDQRDQFEEVPPPAEEKLKEERSREVLPPTRVPPQPNSVPEITPEEHKAAEELPSAQAPTPEQLPPKESPSVQPPPATEQLPTEEQPKEGPPVAEEKLYQEENNGEPPAAPTGGPTVQGASTVRSVNFFLDIWNLIKGLFQ